MSTEKDDPIDVILASHSAILGKTGSGKTSTGKLAVERMVGYGHRVCILDPIKSDWWGLASSSDGKKPGLPFNILGGPRGHVPLHHASGKAIAEIVANGSLPLSIIDMADFPPGGQSKFFIDFAPMLLRKMQGVVTLVLEEAHLFAPKERSGVGDENMAIHWAKMLATAGRSKGIRLMLVTQRTQALHNALLGSCETMVAHRLTAPADQKPVVDWLKANTSKEVVEKVSGSMSSLKTGTAWVCSGEAKFFEMVKFGRIKTYDNSATPVHGAVGSDAVKTATVDLDNLRAIMGAAASEAEANDPKVLRRQLEEANKTLAKLKLTPAVNIKPGPMRAVQDKAAAAAVKNYRAALEMAMKFIIEINAANFFKAGSAAVDQPALEKVIGEAVAKAVKAMEPQLSKQEKEIEKLRESSEKLVARLKAVLQQDVTISLDVTHNEPFTIKAASAAPRSIAAVPKAVTNGSGALDRPLQKIIDAIRYWNEFGLSEPTHSQVAFIAGYVPGSGTWSRYLSALRSMGLIEPKGALKLTEAGLNAANDPDSQPDAEALRESVIGKLDAPLVKILRPLLECYPAPMSHDDLAAAANYVPGSGTWARYLSALRSLDLIEKRGELKAQDWLFP